MIPTPNDQVPPAEPPNPWVTHLTCPACQAPDALLVFDGVGTVCAECGDATRVMIADGSEDA